MIPALPLFHRVAGQPVIVLGEGEAAEAKRRLVERAGGIVTDREDAAARLAFVALDAPEEATARLRGRGVLVNVVDRPDLCDFTVPSLLDRAPVLVAIGTGGASAGLAKALRLRLEPLLPPSLGRLAEGLAGARSKLRARWSDAGDRRRALDAALGAGGPLDPLQDASADRIDAWLGDLPESAPADPVEIRLRSDDPDDLTLREARLLGSADVLACEPDVPPAVLDRARADAVRVALAVGESLPVRSGLVVGLRR
jgi:uroporphyrin-III C-methyltransferase/precorrin-2 dehydrogenase/sirohydrochlorin ferrochelatase